MIFKRFAKTGLSLLCLSAFSAATAAHALPSDLAQILNVWQTLPTTSEASKLIRLESYTMPAPGVDMNKQLIDFELENQSGFLGGDVDLVQFNVLNKDSRSVMMKALFPTSLSNGKIASFCQAFPSKPVKAKAGENPTAAELQAMQEKADKRNCKSSMNKLLGGVLHANPLTYEIATSMATANSASATQMLSFYVTSLVDPSQAIRVSIQL